MAVHVVDHPLVRHKLGILRKESTSTSEFRMLAKEIARGAAARPHRATAPVWIKALRVFIRTSEQHFPRL